MTYESYLNPQKKILRCIKFEPFLSPNTPIFQSLKTLKIVDVLHLNILTFVYKSIDKLSPSCFHDYFQPNSSVHRIGTRQATRGDLFKSFKNTTLYGLQTEESAKVVFKLLNKLAPDYMQHLFVRYSQTDLSMCFAQYTF